MATLTETQRQYKALCEQYNVERSVIMERLDLVKSLRQTQHSNTRRRKIFSQEIHDRIECLLDELLVRHHYIRGLEEQIENVHHR